MAGVRAKKSLGQNFLKSRTIIGRILLQLHPHEDDTTTSLELEALAYTARRTAEQVIEHSPNVPDEA